MTLDHSETAKRWQVLGLFPWPTGICRRHGTACATAVLLGLLVVSTPFMPAAAQQTMPIPLNVQRYARHLIEKYDANGDGVLQPEEWKEMRGDPGAADANGDGVLDVHELARHIADYGSFRRIRLMPSSAGSLDRLPPLLYDALAAGETISMDAEILSQPADAPADKEPARPAEIAGEKRFTVKPSRLPPGLPAWFHQLDADGDGQITLSEFAPTGSAAAIREFEAYDHNRDGVITPREAAAGPKHRVRDPADEP